MEMRNRLIYLIMLLLIGLVVTTITYIYFIHYLKINIVPNQIWVIIYPLYVMLVHFLITHIDHYYQKKAFNKSKKLFLLIRIIYVCLIISLLFFRVPTATRAINLKPLWMASDFITNFGDILFIFNILVFIPIPFLFKIKWYLMIMGFFILEFLQMVFHLGAFDINDIILYTTSLGIGHLCLYLFKEKTKKDVENET